MHIKGGTIMSLEFSRRSFLKYTAVAAVAVAGASMFSGCEQTDTKNISCTGAGKITVLQITAELGTYDESAKKYKDIDLTSAEVSLPFKVTVGRTNNLYILPNNFKATVYDANGKQKAKYIGGNSNLEIPESLQDTNLAKDGSASGTIKLKLGTALAAGEKVVLTYCPDLQYAEYSLNWTLAVPAAEKKDETTSN